MADITSKKVANNTAKIMSRNLMLLGGLLAASLLWAFLVTHPLSDGPSDSTVPVWRLQPRDVVRITYTSANTTVTLEPEWGDGPDSPYVWINSTRTPAVGKNRKKKRRPAPTPKTVSFKGNSAAERLIEQFVSLDAKRSLGNLEHLDGKEFGLPAPDRTVKVELRGGKNPLLLEVGSSTYGNLMRYGYSPSDGRVYLFPQAIFSRFSRAQSALFDRALFPLAPASANHIRILTGGSEKLLWKLDGVRENPWGARPSNTEGEQEMALFVNALKNLRAIAFLEENDDSGQQDSPELEIQIFRDAAPDNPHWLRLYPISGTDTVARSSYTRKTVRVSHRLAKSVLDRGRKLLAER